MCFCYINAKQYYLFAEFLMSCIFLISNLLTTGTAGADPEISLEGVHVRLRCSSRIVKDTTKPYLSQCNHRGKTG